jgi:hypothetical protein
MAVLAQTCKIALPARVAARSGKTARRSTAVVAKAAAPVDAVRVQQKVRTAFSKQARYPYIHLADRGAALGVPVRGRPRDRAGGVRTSSSRLHRCCGGRSRRRVRPRAFPRG